MFSNSFSFYIDLIEFRVQQLNDVSTMFSLIIKICDHFSVMCSTVEEVVMSFFFAFWRQNATIGFEGLGRELKLSFNSKSSESAFAKQ